MRSQYVLVTKKELETVLFFKKRTYKLNDLKSYECKKIRMSQYCSFTMYFAEKICVVSVLDREKFANLLNAVIEKNKANSNVSESDV